MLLPSASSSFLTSLDEAAVDDAPAEAVAEVTVAAASRFNNFFGGGAAKPEVAASRFLLDEETAKAETAALEVDAAVVVDETPSSGIVALKILCREDEDDSVALRPGHSLSSFSSGEAGAPLAADGTRLVTVTVCLITLPGGRLW